MKFVHSADIHLDSPLRGLERYPGAPVQSIRNATRRALENLVQLCLSERVDFLLIAGDLYDGDWRDYNTGLYFVSQMALLSRAGIRVIIIRGNHDAASQITRNLRLPDGVFELSTRKAETILFEELGVAFHGRGYPRRDVNENMVADYPEPRQGYFNIGLLHTALDGREGHDVYAPCSISELIAKGYQYWALGHVHKREVVCEDPWIIFPGNLQGRHARETGAKGATLVTVSDGCISTVEHRPLDVLRWLVCTIDTTAAGSSHELVEQVREALASCAGENDGQLLAVRVRLEGVTKIHHEFNAHAEDWKNQIRAAAADLDGETWIEKIDIATRTPVDPNDFLQRDDPVAGLVRTLRLLKQEPAELKSLLREFDDLTARLPADYRQFEDALDLNDSVCLQRLLEDVEQLLISRLLDTTQ